MNIFDDKDVPFWFKRHPRYMSPKNAINFIYEKCLSNNKDNLKIAFCPNKDYNNLFSWSSMMYSINVFPRYRYRLFYLPKLYKVPEIELLIKLIE
jgi:hypothetical protein